MQDFIKNFPRYIVRTIIVICFLVLVTTFTTRLFQLAFHKPDYNTFCPDNLYTKQYLNETDCSAEGGQWSSYALSPTPEGIAPAKDAVTGSCNITYTCNKAYEEANKTFERNMFIAIVLVGLILLIVSTFITQKLLALSMAITGGFITLYGAIRYFGNAPEVVRLIFLAIGILVLIYIILKRESRFSAM